MNDYELLYLIGERNDDALALMVQKYQPLIISKLFHFNIRPSERDDYMQEGNMMLLHAIKVFNPVYQKTFTRFFELILTRKFMSLMTPAHKQMIYLSEELIDHLSVEEEPRWRLFPRHLTIAKATLKPLEYDVFVEHYQHGYSIEHIAITKQQSVKKIYNTLYQIKNKLRQSADFLDND
jgi:RNA polymerase sporulation-specific sigma factor